jgi:hypothetical protein
VLPEELPALPLEPLLVPAPVVAVDPLLPDEPVVLLPPLQPATSMAAARKMVTRACFMAFPQGPRGAARASYVSLLAQRAVGDGPAGIAARTAETSEAQHAMPELVRPATTESRADFARGQLILLLRLAYSGELAATRAYLGHRHALRSKHERADVGRITREEIRHRACLLEMLHDLGTSFDRRRERKMNLVGRSIALFCQVGGWFFPMYGAARLEAQNIREYELAARLAHVAGVPALISPLLEMAEVEWDHEAYFRGQAMTHVLWRLMPKWPLPPARTTIRESFAAFASGSDWVVPALRIPLLVR